MPISPFNDDLNIIGSLSDNPNTGDNLTSQELKERFDKGPLAIQKFINDKIVKFLNSLEDTLKTVVGFTGTHKELKGRDEADQHTISAITGLSDALDDKAPTSHQHNAEDILTVIPVEFGGTGAQTAAEALSNLGGISKTKYVGATGESLDSYINTGIYFFGNSTNPTNAPVSGNGWLIVLSSTGVDGVLVYAKQIWLRAGTPGFNDMGMWVRTKGNATSTWGPWFTAMTNVLTSEVYGDSLPENPVTGQLFFLPADVADEMGL